MGATVTYRMDYSGIKTGLHQTHKATQKLDRMEAKVAAYFGASPPRSKHATKAVKLKQRIEKLIAGKLAKQVEKANREEIKRNYEREGISARGGVNAWKRNSRKYDKQKGELLGHTIKGTKYGLLRKKAAKAEMMIAFSPRWAQTFRYEWEAYAPESEWFRTFEQARGLAHRYGARFYKKRFNPEAFWGTRKQMAERGDAPVEYASRYHRRKGSVKFSSPFDNRLTKAVSSAINEKLVL